jgi:hypothetical protein
MICLFAMSVQTNISLRIKWRASLVPAAAVIPAPLAYANAAAVKKLVVCFQHEVSFVWAVEYILRCRALTITPCGD